MVFFSDCYPALGTCKLKKDEVKEARQRRPEPGKGDRSGPALKVQDEEEL